MNNEITKTIENLCSLIAELDFEAKVDALNFARERLHQISPFQREPTDFIKWVPVQNIKANEYNPNKVARPEMELLYRSIKEDGITMPIVGMENPETRTTDIVDGFHRRETIAGRRDISDRTFGFAPVSLIVKEIGDRMAATIRHNRARGKHGVEPMAAIVRDLCEKNWSHTEIANHLGMEAEEILRLKQVEGIAAVLAAKHYDRAWEVADAKRRNKN